MMKLEVELCRDVIHFLGAEGSLGTGLEKMTSYKPGFCRSVYLNEMNNQKEEEGG